MYYTTITQKEFNKIWEATRGKTLEEAYDYLNMPNYNPETHELVEKKEAKKARLEAELEQLNEEVKYYDELILKTSKNMSERLDKIDEIKEELNELE